VKHGQAGQFIFMAWCRVAGNCISRQLLLLQVNGNILQL